MGVEPKFFTVNRLDKKTVIVSSNPASAATHSRLFDRDTELLYKTIGANLDATTVTLTFTLQSGGLDFKQALDTIVIRNHNIKGLTVKVFNSNTLVFDTVFTSVVLATNFEIITFAKRTEAIIQIEMSLTQTTDVEKEIGEINFMETLYEAPTNVAFSALGIDFAPVADLSVMSDNGLAINQLRWAGNRVERYNARVEFERLAKADYDALRAVVKKGVFTIQPEPTQRPDEFFEVTHIPGRFPANYATRTKLNGYNLGLNLVER